MKAPRFWYRPPGLAAALLAPLGTLYGAAGRWRRAWATPWPAPVPVICIGNLVAGGAGKTPVAIAVARRLAASGRVPHFLTRGHGGRLAGPVRVDPAMHDAGAVGDEPLLLAAYAPTWVARDRVAGAQAAVAAGAGVVVMDDGFQNPYLRQDLALLVVDGEVGLGNGRLIPAGPLRETAADGLARAGALVVMGADRLGIGERLAARPGVPGASAAAAPLPLLHGRLVPDGAAERLRGATALAFAGIARPDKVFATLERLGVRLAGRVAFPDHHRFSPDELMRLAEAASSAGATLVTTAKDHARLPAAARAMVEVVGVEVEWADPDALDRVLGLVDAGDRAAPSVSEKP